jgi:hypothetical protein
VVVHPNGTVTVAKLDRLTRDVHFGSGLMARKVAFKVCDLPNADDFQLRLFLALAEKFGGRCARQGARSEAGVAERPHRHPVLFQQSELTY